MRVVPSAQANKLEAMQHPRCASVDAYTSNEQEQIDDVGEFDKRRPEVGTSTCSTSRRKAGDTHCGTSDGPTRPFILGD